jgi:hypothetical protein
MVDLIRACSATLCLAGKRERHDWDFIVQRYPMADRGLVTLNARRARNGLGQACGNAERHARQGERHRKPATNQKRPTTLGGLPVSLSPRHIALHHVLHQERHFSDDWNRDWPGHDKGGPASAWRSSFQNAITSISLLRSETSPSKIY